MHYHVPKLDPIEQVLILQQWGMQGIFVTMFTAHIRHFPTLHDKVKWEWPGCFCVIEHPLAFARKK
jgi:hypothetical protein